MKLLKAFCITLYLCAALAASSARAQDVGFEVRKPQGDLKNAQPFPLQFSPVLPQGYSIAPSTGSSPSKQFTVVSIEKKDNIYTFTVVPFAIDKSSFPAMDWTLQPAGGGSTQTVKSPEIPLSIVPQTQAKKGDAIKDIRPPVHPFNWLLWLIIAALLALIYYGYRKFAGKKKLSPAAAAAMADNRPPDVIALEALDKLLGSPLWQAGQFKVFYNAMSDIARDYITRRYRLDAHKLTTTDLVRELKRDEQLDKLQVASLRSFLASCDMVKFAKLTPEESDKHSDVGILKDFVRRTAPPPPPPPGQAQHAAPSKGGAGR